MSQDQVVLSVRDIAAGGEVFAAFPPFVYAQFGDGVCVGLPTGCDAYGRAGPLSAMAIRRPGRCPTPDPA